MRRSIIIAALLTLCLSICMGMYSERLDREDGQPDMQEHTEDGIRTYTVPCHTITREPEKTEKSKQEKKAKKPYSRVMPC